MKMRPVNRVIAAAIAVAACNGQTATTPSPVTPPAAAPVVSPPPVVGDPQLTGHRPSSAPPRRTGPTRGAVVQQAFDSAALGVRKDVWIYLPEGYDTSGRRYPVFYYLHGLGGDETNWLKLGNLEQTANAIGLDAIVVMPDGDAHFYIDGARTIDYDTCMRDGSGMFLAHLPRDKNCTRTTKYATYITRDLIGWVDKTYRTIASRDGRAIAGLSMGGFGALVLALKNPSLFAAAVSHSGVDALLYQGPYPYAKGKVTLYDNPDEWGRMLGSFGGWIRSLFGSDIATWRANDPSALIDKLAPGVLKLYLDCGTEDDFLLNNGMQYLHDKLVARGIDHAYYLGPGSHNFSFWAERLPKSLEFLRDATAAPR